jgi:hypothetical protein
MPDADLSTAADGGKLGTRADVEAQVRRMLADPRAGQTLVRFHGQWWGLGSLADIAKDADSYPAFAPSIIPSLEGELEAFVRATTIEKDGGLAALLQSPHTFVDEPLAKHYGVARPPGAGFQPVELDPKRYAGLLTQPGLLSYYAETNQTSPVRRGQFVRERLLCQELPPPPAGVDVEVPVPSKTATTRERWAAHSAVPQCASCHKLIDPIGFAFETFDGVGKWRDRENNKVIDASGELIDAGDASGTFTGVRGLADRLAGSRVARACLVTQWFRYAHGRHEGPQDRCVLDDLGRTLDQTSGGVRALVTAATIADSFLYQGPQAAEGGSP